MKGLFEGLIDGLCEPRDPGRARGPNGDPGARWGNPGTLGPTTHVNWDLGPHGPNGSQGPRNPWGPVHLTELRPPMGHPGPSGPNGTQAAVRARMGPKTHVNLNLGLNGPNGSQGPRGTSGPNGTQGAPRTRLGSLGPKGTQGLPEPKWVH